MKIFLFIALVLFVLSLITLVVPTVILGASWATWMVAGFISVVVDKLLGDSRVTVTK
jgi:hypothetical protein